MKKISKILITLLVLATVLTLLTFTVFGIGSDGSKNNQVNVKWFDEGVLLKSEKVEIGTPLSKAKADEVKVSGGITYVLIGWTEDRNSDVPLKQLLPTKDTSYYAIYKEAQAVTHHADGSVTVHPKNADVNSVINSVKAGDRVEIYKDVSLLKHTFSVDCTIDFNGHKVNVDERSTATNATVTFVGGNLTQKSGLNNMFYVDGSRGKTIFENCTLNSSGVLADMRNGEFLFKNSIINGGNSGSEIFGMFYRGEKLKITFDNTVINATNRPAIFSASRLKSEVKPYFGEVNFVNGSVVGEGFASLSSISNTTEGGKTSKFKVNISSDCKFAMSSPTVNSNIKDFIMSVELGAKFAGKPDVTGAPVLKNALVFGNGEGFLIDISEDVYKYMVASSDSVSKITFKCDKKDWTITVNTFKGQMPKVPCGNGYRFIPDEEIQPANGDRVYTGKYEFDSFDVHHNITLSYDFSYNIYVKRASGLLEISVDGNSISSLGTLDTWNGYYIVRFNGINAINAGSKIVLKVVCEGPVGVAFKFVELSIPDYLKSILTGDFSKETKALASDVLNYLDASYVAYGKKFFKEYNYIHNLKPLYDEYKTDIPFDFYKSDMDKIAFAITGARLNLANKTKIRFNLSPDYTGKMLITYPYSCGINTREYHIKNGLCDGKSYIEFDMRVFDLTKEISFAVQKDGSVERASYSVYNYYNSVKNNKNFEPLVKAIIAYSTSAEAYRLTYKPSSVGKITVDGKDISEFTLVYDESDSVVREIGEFFHSKVLEYSGVFMKVSNTETKNSINIKFVENLGDCEYRISVKNGNMYIECSKSRAFKDATMKFMEKYFLNNKEDGISFENGIVFEDLELIFTYEEFGAVGDGINDDFYAIKATHERANITGRKVVATPGKTYNLGQHGNSIVVKTNVVLTGAKFIIDDSSVMPGTVADTNIFVIESDYAPFDVKGIKPLKEGQQNIGVKLPHKSLVRIVNEKDRQYIRYGGNENSGSPMQEVILVDENGNVDPSTPIMWNYREVTYAVAYPCIDTPITIDGGEFITIANRAPRQYTYYDRGFQISRSNVTLKNIVHKITGEGSTGAPYAGFFNITRCNNVLITDTILTGHKVYKEDRQGGGGTMMGTYELGGNNSNNITWKNVTQTNSIYDSRYWGVMGSNFCKNLTYDGCKLSRFDAHQGVYNATVKNSDIGYQFVRVVGKGLLTVENTTVSGNHLIHLRGDYGSTWEGDAIIKNVTLNNSGNVTLFDGSWVNHYFGYTCHLPGKIVVDGVKLKKSARVYILPPYSASAINPNGKNPLVVTKLITVSNVPYSVAVSSKMDIYKKTDLTKK